MGTVRVIGIRCDASDVAMITLSHDGELAFIEQQRLFLPTSIRSESETLDHAAALVDFAVQRSGASIAALVTCTAGARLRRLTVARLHIEGAIILSLRRVSQRHVVAVTTGQMKRLAPFLSGGCASAMDLICARLHLQSGRNGQITRDPYSLDAFGGAIFALASQGHKLPDWVNPTRARGFVGQVAQTQGES